MHTQLTFKKTLASLILAMSLPIASTAFAHTHDAKSSNGHCERIAKHGMHHAGMGKSSMPHYLKVVDLTEAQKDQVFTIQHAQAPKMREQHKAQYKLMQEMRATTQADQFDEAKAKSIANQMAALNQEKILARAQTQAKIFALLTPEQRIKAREFKMHKSWGNHAGRGEYTNYKGRRHMQNEVKS